MDFTTGDVAIRHAVNFPSPLIIKHIIDCTPGTLEVLKEIRKCVIAVAAAWVAVGAFRSLFELIRGRDRGRLVIIMAVHAYGAYVLTARA